MTLTLTVIITLVLSASGLTLAALHLAFRAPASRPLRIREEPVRKLQAGQLLRSGLVNASLSTALVYGLALGLAPWLFYEAAPSLGRGLWEVVGVLLVYDLLYYLLHRYPFHRWGWLKRVHTMHHKARYPIALDSLYLHPVETALGLALLFSCVALLGPVSVYSFAALFFLHSQLNIIVHCGLDLPLLGHMARKHDRHHVSMRSGNYASITPLPDLLFGTAE